MVKSIKKSSKAKSATILDSILDRMDGFRYSPRDFYNYVSAWDVYNAEDIARALDMGEEEDVRRELHRYLDMVGNAEGWKRYPEEWHKFIDSVNWIKEGKRGGKVKRANMKKKAYSDWRIFIGCILCPTCGKWVDLPCSEGEIDEAIKYALDEYRVLGEGDCEEVFIPDYEGYYGLSASEMEYVDPYRLNDAVGELLGNGEYLPREVMNAAIEMSGDIFKAAEIIEDVWYIAADSDEDLAYKYIDEMGGVEQMGKDELERYFDYAAFGRDLAYDFYEFDGYYVHWASKGMKYYVCLGGKKMAKKIGEKRMGDMLGKSAKKASRRNRKFAGDVEDMLNNQYGDDYYAKHNPWRGHPNIEMEWYNTQSDPSLIYNDYRFNYGDMEDALWDMFLEDNGISEKDTYDGNYNISREWEDKFNRYVQDYAEGYFEDVLYSGYFQDGSKDWRDRYAKANPSHKGAKHAKHVKKASGVSKDEFISEFVDTLRSEVKLNDVGYPVDYGYYGYELEHAVQKYIEDQLFYTDDIMEIAKSYLDGSQMLDMFYGQLFDDMYSAAEDEFE